MGGRELPAGVSREYSSYCGSYTYDGEKLVTRVDAASDPSRIGSDRISILVATLVQNTQVIHSRLVEGLRPDNPLAQAPYLTAPFSLSTPSGMAALNAEVTRQAAMVAYIDDFKLIMLIALASIPLLLLLREARRRPPPTAAVSTAAADD
jgi:hypothetical protein